MRNAEQLLLALVIPLAILVAGRFANASSDSLELLGPSVLALASVVLGVHLGRDQHRVRATLRSVGAVGDNTARQAGLLAGKALAVIMILLGQLVILAGAAVGLGWRPRFTPVSAVLAVVLVILATATFVASPCCLRVDSARSPPWVLPI